MSLSTILALLPLLTPLTVPMAVSIRTPSTGHKASIPLHNSMHNWFPLSVGNQPFRAIFDTGSPDMWIPFYADGAPGGYNTSHGINQNFTDGVTYVSGASDKGEVYADDVCIGGLEAKDFNVIAVNKTGGVADRDANNALIGLSYSPASGTKDGEKGLFETLIDQGQLEEKEVMFYFGKKGSSGIDDGAEVVLGGRDGRRWQGDLTFAPLVKSGDWSIDVDGLSVDGGSVGNGTDGFQVLIDTGTSGIQLPIPQADALHAAIPGAVKSSSSSTSESTSYTYPCDLDPAKAPAFVIHGTTMKLSADDLNDGPAAKSGEGEEKKMCRSVVTGSKGKNGLLGVQFMRSWVPIFHWGGKTVGKEVGRGAGISFGKVCRGRGGGACVEDS